MASPVGMETNAEYMQVELARYVPDAWNILAQAMPEGIAVLSAADQLPNLATLAAVEYQYALAWTSPSEREKSCALFDGRPLVIAKKTKKGVSNVDIAPQILRMDITHDALSSAVLSACLAGGESPLSPLAVCKAMEAHACAPETRRIVRTRVLDIRGEDWT